jgi:protein phosphatase
MPDPQVLYIVTAVVVLGLVAWVIVVLSRPDAEGKASASAADRNAKTSPPGVLQPVKPAPLASATPATPAEPKPPVHPTPRTAARQWLQSHTEIQDEHVPPGPAENDDVGEDVRVDVEEDDEPTGPNALILVTAVGRTDPGLKRKHNEDAYAILEDHHLFVIADGMGRHAAGEVASRLCVDAITEAFQTSSFGPPRKPTLNKRAARLRGATLLANEKILRAAEANEAYAGMGTTVVSAYFSANNQRVYIAHVGDSRCYRLRGGKLTQLTTDHTLGAAGIQGKSAGILSRAVGIEPDVEVELTVEAPVHGDVYLLCSDGLSRMVNADEIAGTLSQVTDLDEATKTLTEMANERGGRDNITVILVRVDNARLV